MDSTQIDRAADTGLLAQFRMSRGNFRLVADLDLPGRGVTALFGPSGSGKTSVLRLIAGLERAGEGFVKLGATVWQDDAKGIFVPVHRRPLGFVFQEASLFGHLSVRGNLEYGFKRVPAGERRVDFDAAVELLGLHGLLERTPQYLSGGERQRVAIARALLASPRLLLMDEPLAALDAHNKASIIPYLERLHAELEIPVLYVTHAMDEVARLADHLVLMRAGQVTASGPLQEVLTGPGMPLASDEGAGSVVFAEVDAHDEAYGLSRLRFPGGVLWVAHIDKPLGASVRARVLARDVSISRVEPAPSSILNVLPCRVERIVDDGPDKVSVLLVTNEGGQGGASIIARITRRSRDVLVLHEGDAAYAQVKSVALLA